MLMVVDDHELVADSLAFMLQLGGLDGAISCSSAEEMLETVRTTGPTLVLLDLDLVARCPCAVSLIRPIIEAGGRVVMMTDGTDRHRLAECVEAGASGVLRKSGRVTEFVEAVQRALAGEDLIGPTERQALLVELQAWRQADLDRLAPFASLTPRERAVLARLVLGESAETIAAGSALSLHTIRSQIKSLLFKLGVSSQLGAVALARRAGWPSADA
jgi:DNA-binding NarL/FixJ family response regulator